MAGGDPDEAVGDPVDGVVGIVLAAGAGTRLRPLTLERPKALCPVGDVPLVDLAVDRVAPFVGAVAVNVHHGRDQLEPHLFARGDVHVSVEAEDVPPARSPFSASSTEKPRPTASRAMPQPLTPPPITTRSNCSKPRTPSAIRKV